MPVAIGLIVAMALQLASLSFVYCRKRQLEERVDDPELQDKSSARLLSSAATPATKDDERAVAARRYHDKKRDYYTKYSDVIKR